MNRNEWSQAQAAEVLGVNQPKVSALQKYKLEVFSIERLMGLTYRDAGKGGCVRNSDQP